jgi:aminoglycoside phosphotransferase (APT) family kinase protein
LREEYRSAPGSGPSGEVPYDGSMRDVGSLIASGRDADIFEFGKGLVLRRSKTHRSMAHEARVMEYVAAQGYPVPRVHDVRGDGTELVMDRIEGPSMLDAIARQPWTLWRHGATLARLHRELHELAAPEWLDSLATAAGDRIGHFDLHPMNVLLSPSGPVVIDWTNAAAARPAADVALTWLLLAAGQVGGSGLKPLLVRAARQRFVNAFLSSFPRHEIVREFDGVIAWKTDDPHMSCEEIASMRAVASKETPG